MKAVLRLIMYFDIMGWLSSILLNSVSCILPPKRLSSKQTLPISTPFNQTPKPASEITEVKLRKVAALSCMITSALLFSPLTVQPSNSIITSNYVNTSPNVLSVLESRSPKIRDRARLKRTKAIKELESKGIIQIETDDAGNQVLKLPWIPNQKIPYKSLSIQQRLQNEVCAGAFGEFCKDLILHPVDTLKTRRQAAKKKCSVRDESTEVVVAINTTITTNAGLGPLALLTTFKNLYSGFPIVVASSIPQGGIFFLAKKGVIELISRYFPACPEIVKAFLSSSVGTMGYWSFRTPAEIIKTQVQTGQSPTVKESLHAVGKDNDGQYQVLWKYYPVMLYLDIPFQVMNFILYGFINDTLMNGGFEQNTWTRLFCGVVSGMTCAGVTCPVDVCKTRIVSRDKENTEFLKYIKRELQSISIALKGHSNLQESEMQTNTKTSAPGISTQQPTTPTEATLEGTDWDSTPASVAALVSPPQQKLIHALQSVNQISANPTVFESNIELLKNKYVALELQQQEVMNRMKVKATVPNELVRIFKDEGLSTLFLGLKQRLIYVGLANGIRLAAYGTSRMDLMMKSLDDI